jgi:hypothetical protein
MLGTQELFGEPVQFDQIASCRVNRLRVEVGGIQTAIARVALGGRRTQIWLTLTDGRRLGSVARDDPQHASALEQFLDELERDRAGRWLAAIGRGETVDTGKVTFTRDLIQVGRKSLAWRDVGGWSMRDGGLMVDGLNHRMVINLWIATTPWSGAIANMLEAMAPGKNYAHWPSTALPRVGFTATSALTHIPGTMTMRGRGYLLLAMVAIPLLGLAGYGLWYQHEEGRLRGHYTRTAREAAAELAPQLADPAFAAIEPCKPTEYGHYTTYLVGVRGVGTDAKLTRGKTPISELDTYPSELLVWDVVGDTTRAILVEDRLGGSGEKRCRATTPGAALEPLLDQLEHKASKAEIEAANAEASPPSPPPEPSDDAVAAAGTTESNEPAGSDATAPARTSQTTSSKVSKKTSSTSGLSAQAIRKTVKGSQARIRACYEKALLANPNLSGRVDVKLEIASSGKVSSATGSSKLPESVRACVVRVFEAMRFPSSSRATTVAYPIVFQPS